MKRIIPVRYMLVVMMFLLSVLLYVDRICISVAKEPIAEAFQFTDKQMGWILSAFALGYALFQTPSGALADRFGPRIILTAVVSFWSLFTALTATAFNFISMLVIRFLFGMGEAGAFPNMARTIYSWMPMNERGRVQGINFSGSRLGAAFALPGVAWMVAELGWQLSFVILAVIGFVWAIIFYMWFRNDPTEHPTIDQVEKDYILSTRQKSTSEDTNQTKPEPLNVGVLFGSKNMWLAMIQYFCSNFTFFFTLTWLFPHIQQKFGLDTVEAGFYASVPLIAGAFGNWFSGWMVDAIYKRGHWEWSRKATAMLGFLLAALGLIGSIYMETAGLMILFLSIAIFGADMTLSPSWSLCIDIGHRNSGAVSGTMNMAGNIGSFITALAFPYLLDWSGSEVPFFYVGTALNILAIFIWLAIRPNKTLEEY